MMFRLFNRKRTLSSPTVKEVEGPEVSAAADRRTVLLAGAVGSVLLAPSSAYAKASEPSSTPPSRGAQAGLRDRLAIIELIGRERSFRDAAQWDAMATCFHPDATVEVSWFKGSGADFVTRSKANFVPDRISLHQLGQTAVTVGGNGRAISETSCQLFGIVQIDGIEVCLVNFARLLYRHEMSNGEWLVAGIRMIYIRDLILPTIPSQVPQIDPAELSRYRASYRFLSYSFARTSHPARDDLPGMDRPETVAALRVAEADWLHSA